MFLTHMLLLLLLSLLLLVLSPAVSAESVCVVSLSDMMFLHVWPWLPSCMFEWPPSLFLFFWHNLSNLDFCLSRVLKCLDSLYSLMNCVHCSILSLSNVLFRCSVHVSIWIFNMAMVLFTNLTVLFNRALSAFLMIWWPLGVLIELLSLILTGIMSSPRHLKVNLLWLEKSTILFSIFSHQWKIFTFFSPYSLLICIWILLILFDLMY